MLKENSRKVAVNDLDGGQEGTARLPSIIAQVSQVGETELPKGQLWAWVRDELCRKGWGVSDV